MTLRRNLFAGLSLLCGLSAPVYGQGAFKPVTLEAGQRITVQAEDYDKGGKGVGYQARQMKYQNPAGNEFPILAWHGPQVKDNWTNPQRFIEMRNAGFNISFSANHHWNWHWDRSHWNSVDELIANSQGSQVRQMVGTGILQEAPAIKGHPEVALWHIADEPLLVKTGADLTNPEKLDFDDLFSQKTAARNIDDSKLLYVNLLPIEATGYATGGTGTSANDYMELYVRRFANEIGTGFLSWDNYPFKQQSASNATPTWKKATGGELNFFQNLQVMSRVSRETNQPLWAFVMTMQHENEGDYLLSKDWTNASDPWWMMRLELWSNLAHGAQCIQYFAYEQTAPMADKSSYMNWAPLTYDQATQQWGLTDIYWSGVAGLNQKIQQLAPVFLGAKVVNVGHLGSNASQRPRGTDEFKKLPESVSKINTTTGFLVSHLKNGNDEYLMVVNTDIRNSQSFSISWKNGYAVQRIYDTAAGLTREAAGTTYTVGIGDYLLFHW